MVNDICRNSVNILKPTNDVNNIRQFKKKQAVPDIQVTGNTRVTLNPRVAADRQTAPTSHLCRKLIHFKPAEKTASVV